MNLHEECLLKYLLNTTDLFQTTEKLKQTNDFLELSLSRKRSRNMIKNLNYAATQI